MPAGNSTFIKGFWLPNQLESVGSSGFPTGHVKTCSVTNVWCVMYGQVAGCVRGVADTKLQRLLKQKS